MTTPGMVTRLQKTLKLWQPVIGLEIHAQLATNSKLFSGSGTSFTAATNDQVSFHDMALPGTLPVLNRACVELAVRVALALDCRLNLVSEFDRKHYFYADLPAGYQITQQRRPLARDGSLRYLWRSDVDRRVHSGEANIVQVQLEQDSGRSLHSAERGLSFIDLNRAGVGLVEIITAPDFNSGAAAAGFVHELRNVLTAVGACTGDMSQGALRVDANISVRRHGGPLGVRAEVKNLNSLAKVARAVDLEVQRQAALLEAGGVVENETRAYDAEADVTVSMRDKERLQDYRYCPEPNLPPLRLLRSCASCSSCSQGPARGPSVCVECARRSLPPLLPPARRRWLHERLGVPLKDADVLLTEEGLFQRLLDALAAAGRPQLDAGGPDADVAPRAAALGRETAHWLSNFCLGQTRKGRGPWEAATVAGVAALRLDGRVDQTGAKALLMALLERPGANIEDVARAERLLVTSDAAVVRTAVRAVLAAEAGKAQEARKGRKKARTFLLRRVAETAPEALHEEVVARELDTLLREGGE